MTFTGVTVQAGHTEYFSYLHSPFVDYSYSRHNLLKVSSSLMNQFAVHKSLLSFKMLSARKAEIHSVFVDSMRDKLHKLNDKGRKLDTSDSKKFV